MDHEEAMGLTFASSYMASVIACALDKSEEDDEHGLWVLSTPVKMMLLGALHIYVERTGHRLPCKTYDIAHPEESPPTTAGAEFFVPPLSERERNSVRYHITDKGRAALRSVR